MAGASKIEWTDMTWNPTTGCTKVSQGCRHCYAERIFKRPYPGREFTDVRIHPDRLDQPLRWRKPKRIFVNSMSDLFHEAVPFGFIKDVFAVTQIAQHHTFQILTKRPERMRAFAQWMAGADDISIAEWPRNVHLGVSCEDQPTADERIPLLLQTPAAVRFVSLEPLLAPIDISPFLCRAPKVRMCPRCLYFTNRQEEKNCPNDGSLLGPDLALDWVIVGGESGPKARPMHDDWPRSLRDQCVAAGVPFFFKQWGEWAPTVTRAGGDLGGDMRRGKTVIIHAPGNAEGCFRQGDALMSRVGKKAAGAMLDGREWREFPQ